MQRVPQPPRATPASERESPITAVALLGIEKNEHKRERVTPHPDAGSSVGEGEAFICEYPPAGIHGFRIKRGMTEPSQRGMTEPSQRGMTEPSQRGMTEPLKIKWAVSKESEQPIL